MSMFHELMMKKKGIPSRYQEVEYIESDGTQYIDTGITADDTTGLNITVQSLLSSDRILVGSRVAGIDSRFYIGSTANYYIGWNVYNTIEIPYSQKAQISLNFYNDRSVYGDGVFKRYVSGTLATQNSTIIIFGLNSSNNPVALCSCKMFNVQISKGSRLVRNFIPVYDTLTNKYGMWESVQGKFYGNDGTGDFKGSIVGYTVVGSPTITDGVVSGFSNANYLQTSQSFDVSQTNWEFVIKASKASTGNARVFCINNGNGALNTIFSVVTNIFFSCQIGSVTLTINQDFVADTFYYFKIKRNGSMLSLSWSADGVTYQDEQSAEVTNWGNSGYVFYGRVAGLSTTGFGGSIDIANSLIKINNKLWFNGQQA